MSAGRPPIGRPGHGRPGHESLEGARSNQRGRPDAAPGTSTRAKAAADKRRSILDAAVRVFARQGFHACRVADIADEAGVAYGLVYHYFASKDEILDTLFLERWNVMLQTIRHVDAEQISAREKLAAIASFIIDSYAHDPELMKVIIVEVTRAANSFGQTHLAQIREAFTLIAEIVTGAQAAGEFKTEITAEFAAIAFYGAIEQVLTGWIFGLLPGGSEHYEQAKRLVVETVCGGLDAGSASAPSPSAPLPGRASENGFV